MRDSWPADHRPEGPWPGLIVWKIATGGEVFPSLGKGADLHIACGGHRPTKLKKLDQKSVMENKSYTTSTNSFRCFFNNSIIFFSASG